MHHLKGSVSRLGFLPLAVAALACSGFSQDRVVAIGDAHGAYSAFTGILQRTGLIDSRGDWAGGSSVLVQTGDVVDRGANSLACVDLLMKLERQAEAENGRVIALLGNHEALTILRDLRYVAPGDYQAFAGPGSEKLRKEAFEEYRKYLSARRRRGIETPADNEGTWQTWRAAHPPGFFERYDAFGPEGPEGRWMRTRNSVVRVGEVVFAHGGLNPALPFKTPRELNERIRGELAEFDALWQALVQKGILWRYMTFEEALQQAQEEWKKILVRGQVEDPETAAQIRKLLGLQTWLILSPDGPLWYRGLALEPEENLNAGLQSLLARLGARALVVGHTVRPKHDITPRFGNRVFLIDTGMLAQEYGGQASALEIRNGRFTAYYQNHEPQVLLGGGPATPPPAGEGGKPAKQDP